MNAQLIENWDDLYEGDNIPQWEDEVPNKEFCQFVLTYVEPGMRVLELGSGLGINAIELAKCSVNITVSDISKNAIHFDF